jgi:hypothetical protein
MDRQPIGIVTSALLSVSRFISQPKGRQGTGESTKFNFEDTLKFPSVSTFFSNAIIPGYSSLVARIGSSTVAAEVDPNLAIFTTTAMIHTIK